MTEVNTENFLSLLNKQNAAIAARVAENQREENVDPIRLQREKERRAKWGALRAREQPSKRPHRTNNPLPYVDLS